MSDGEVKEKERYDGVAFRGSVAAAARADVFSVSAAVSSVSSGRVPKQHGSTPSFGSDTPLALESRAEIPLHPACASAASSRATLYTAVHFTIVKRTYMLSIPASTLYNAHYLIPAFVCLHHRRATSAAEVCTANDAQNKR